MMPAEGLQKQEQVQETVSSEKPPSPRTRGRGRALFVALVVGIALLTGGILYWRYAQTYESTDDAQVDGHLNGITSRIAGTVTAVYTDENQYVKAGQLLAEIDPRDYELALAEAKAEMAQKQAEIQVQNPNIPITETSSETNIFTA